MEFRESGNWFYYIKGPDGSRHYCRVYNLEITESSHFNGRYEFCNEDGVALAPYPDMLWNNSFSEVNSITTVDIIFTPTEENLEKIIEMSFHGGFTMGLNNLAELPQQTRAS